MNKVILCGNLTKDVELTELSNGTKMCRFSLAVKSKSKDENGETITDFFICTAWRVVAENMAKYTHKGDKIAITGSLKNRSWEQDGQKHYTTEVNVEECEFVNSKKDNGKKELEPIPDNKLPF